MWSPTHMIVTVLRAKNLILKGKNGSSNNCFVTIGLGKEKYQTTIKEKSLENVDWHEECELTIPSQGNKAELIFTVLHRNKLGLDDFLGQAVLPLCDMDVYESPRARWCKLSTKQGKENKKERGELEVRISFTVKAGSLKDLSKAGKSRSSINNLTQLGGSLLSLGTLDKRRSLKGFTKNLGNKLKKNKFKNSSDNISSNASTPSLNEFRRHTPNSSFDVSTADPGVISENEDEFVLDNLSQKSSNLSLNITNTNNEPQSKVSNKKQTDDVSHNDEWQQKLFGKKYGDKRISLDSSLKPINLDDKEKVVSSENIEPYNQNTLEKISEKKFEKPSEKSSLKENSFINILTKHTSKNKKNEAKEREQESFVEKTNESKIKLPKSVALKYEGKSREEVILMLHSMESEVSSHKQKIKELEDYLDILLLRVMEREPKILQNPYSKTCVTKSG